MFHIFVITLSSIFLAAQMRYKALKLSTSGVPIANRDGVNIKMVQKHFNFYD